MKENKKSLIIILIVGIVLVVLYFVFFKQEDDEALLSTTTNVITPTNININTITPTSQIDNELAQQILASLSNVKTLTLDDRLFATLAFKTLKDGTVQLDPDAVIGRLNPFAPIGVDPVSGNNNNIIQNTNTQTSLDTTPSEIPLSDAIDLSLNEEEILSNLSEINFLEPEL